MNYRNNFTNRRNDKPLRITETPEDRMGRPPVTAVPLPGNISGGNQIAVPLPEDISGGNQIAVPLPGNVPGGNRPGGNRPGGNQTAVPPSIQIPNRPSAPSFDSVPKNAPPSIVPLRSNGNARIDAGSIQNCVGNFTYVWLVNGSEFWIFPIMVSQRALSGFRWDRRFGWVYYGINLNRIESFFCTPYR